ncbi:MAG: S41 family peptidase [Thermonemataceae bacterium]
MRLSLLILSFTLCTTNIFGQVYFPKNKVLEDLETLKKVLEEAHYNLFAYTTKSDFEAMYHSLKNQIQQDSLTLLQSTNLFQQLSSIVNNGHTYIDFPIQPYVAYIQSGGTLFPLEITFENGKSYVRKNWSENSAIKVGAEIMSINGKFMDEIASKIYPYISAERPYFKKAKIEFYSFPRYYWQVFGRQDSFRIRLKSEKGIKTVEVKSIPAINEFESKRTEIFHSNRQLKYFDSTAYLNPGAFSGNEDTFRAFIDSAFTDIQRHQSSNLIIDLRNNTGGNDSFSDYLVSYFADKPFKWYSDFKIKTSKTLKEVTRKNNDTTKAYFQQILLRKDGEIYAPTLAAYQPQDISRRYKGTIYVLVNRQSISQATVTAAQIQDYSWGTIVGEETGEYPSLYASVFQYPLPNTGIVVVISKGRIIRVNGSKKEEGVLPDIFIKDHLIDEKDEILEGLLEMIQKE